MSHQGGEPTVSAAFGDAAEYEPGSSSLQFVIGDEADLVGVHVKMATLRFAERGTVRVTAQAIIRHGEPFG